MPLLVSLQLALYVLLWALASAALKDERRAILQWMGYALASAGSVALLGWRPDGPIWLTHTGSSAASLLSLMLASRGVLLFLGLRPNDRLSIALAGAAAMGLGWVGPSDTASRLAVAGFFNIVVIVGGFVQSRPAFMREFGLRLAVAATLPSLILIGMNGYFLILGLLGRAPVISAQKGELPMAIWVVTLVSAAAFNYLFLFLVGFRMQQSLQRQATHDVLTGLPNRRAMAQRLQLEWDRSQRYGKPFVVISADVDHFKSINDRYGHALGDQALIAVARALRASARDSDHVSRVGGEEFLILMPEAQMASEGLPKAERLRAAIARLELMAPSGEKIALHASFGVSGWLASDQDREQVLRRADRALYEAKHKGRDRVVLQPD
ncbi:GGDEF domain-containing protein [Roseateles oligotrophus]|uniref:diguanylate cyclase n=1 Tax=Roseateles oligotrophus TaxID=1769250 RepID=A0ABT2YGJ5_9BURK|nr:GGDEF domain-containing protein [Roseateles oligotrophus]MCV2369162.1 GGDEF domain-containing protein [Roseateles oligotrophus]